MPEYFAHTFDFGRDVDGAYTAQPYYPQRERDEIRRWEALTKQEWNRHPADLMLDELPGGTASTNKGCGPAWGDLVQAGYFEVEQ